MPASQITFKALGTSWYIDLYNGCSDSKKSELFDKIMQRIQVFDKAYSRFREDSILTQMSQHSGTYTLPPDAEIMLSLYKKLYEITSGALTPLIGQVLIDAGYDHSYSLESKPLHTPPSWAQTLQFDAPTTLTIKEPTALDFGALGKGYCIDIIGDLLEKNGIESFCIDAGGDILHKNVQGTPIRVGLENPENLEQVIGVATVSNQSICASSGSRRRWGNFHHIINPHTLSSPKEVIATWATASTTIIADGLATCLFLTTPEKLTPHFTFEYLILYADHSITKSNNFPAELFIR